MNVYMNPALPRSVMQRNEHTLPIGGLVNTGPKRPHITNWGCFLSWHILSSEMFRKLLPHSLVVIISYFNYNRKRDNAHLYVLDFQ